MKHQPTASPAKHEVAPKKKQNHALNKSNAPVDPNKNANEELRYEMIRRTAYSLYEARNCVSGHELDDWLQAEAQLNQVSGLNMLAPAAPGQAPNDTVFSQSIHQSGREALEPQHAAH